MGRKRFGSIQNINARNLGKLPDSPGVYAGYDVGKNLLRIGRAKRTRLDDRIAEMPVEHPKVKKFAVITTSTLKEAIKLETKLLGLRKPRLNKEERGK
jgi:excinuclease UvrABC nuclease subunit